MTDATLSEHDLLPTLEVLAGAPRWWLAYSGGLDSTVLLQLLARARAARPGFPPLVALHVNHGLHPDAPRWQHHCEARCRALGIDFDCEAVVVEPAGEGLEAAARRARHAVFESRLGAGDILFTAHHLDDQVETLFLRLLRGAGVDGLGAMAESRPLGAGRLVRPLLDVPRGVLADCARQWALDYIDDPSNEDTRLDRNYLRRRVLPLIAERWPGYRGTVGRAADHLRETAALLRSHRAAPVECRSALGDPGLDLAALDRKSVV